MFKCVFLFSIFASTIFAVGSPDDSGSSSEATVIEIDGIKFTLADLEQKQPTALFQARNAFYEAERKALEEFADSYVLEKQAQKEHLTLTQLLDLHVNKATGPDPSDDALRVYYEGLETNETFEAVRGKILDHIREKRISRAKKAYVQNLRDQVKVTILLTPPRMMLSLTDSPTRGAAVGAPVTLIEFADYECAYCQQAESDLLKLEAEFKGKMIFAFKDLPLPMHAHAEKAAEAAQCAGLQGKYWEFHDALFESKELDLSQLKTRARQLGLDSTAFDECLDSGQRAKAIQQTIEDAQRLGLNGTPSFFLNGHFISGTMKYEQFRQMIEDELKHASAPERRAARQ